MKFTPGDVLNPRYAKVFILARGNNILSFVNKPGEPFPSNDLLLANLDLQGAHYIGDYFADSDGERHCFVLQIKDGDVPESEDLQWSSLRELLGVIPDGHFQMLGRGLQITRWYRDNRYCGRCGNLTVTTLGERALFCSTCEHRYYPRISPCIICLVTRGDYCLLARHARLPEGMYTTLAGFIEPGETAEQAVKREVLEEVNIKVNNLRYFRSQVWPFPGQLMLGFVADYESGELEPDGDEIIEARWFHARDLPLVPPASTIAAQLIRSFVEP